MDRKQELVNVAVDRMAAKFDEMVLSFGHQNSFDSREFFEKVVADDLTNLQTGEELVLLLSGLERVRVARRAAHAWDVGELGPECQQYAYPVLYVQGNTYFFKDRSELPDSTWRVVWRFQD